VTRFPVKQSFIEQPGIEQPGKLGRRAALLLLPAGLTASLAGCSFLDNAFSTNKPTLPGERLAVLAANRGLGVDNLTGRRIELPAAAVNPSWPQAGGDVSHAMGHPAASGTLAEAWTADLGQGASYREKLTAHPVVADGRVFTMDSDAVVSAFDARSGSQLWQSETRAKHNRSTNVGGGVALDGGTLYVATGRGEALAYDAATGKQRWRGSVGSAARAAPTVADGRLYIPTIDDQMVALATTDGRRLWAYQATVADTSLLGLPSPAYADGLLVAGFGSGELVCLRASGGSVAWADSLAATRGRNSLIDLSAIHGMPVIEGGQVFATGLGGLTLALDLRTGRRLWERDIGSAETPWLAGDWLFLLSLDNQLVALNRTDGGLAWTKPLPRFKNVEKQTGPIRWVGPTLAGDRLVLASSEGVAVSASPYTGKLLGQQKLSGPASVAPVVAGGAVYLVTDDAKLLALR